MIAPPFNEPFNTYYDQFSISRNDFAIPDHFDVYSPEFINEIDFQCLSVISPNPDKGAKKWTYSGKWLTIGIYHDEGRDPSQRPPTTTLNWVRVSKLLTLIDLAGHRLKTGDTVNLYNINVPSLLKMPITVINPTTFTVVVPLYGASSGSDGAYQPSEQYNFYEQNYVFRFLPSFKLIPWSIIQDLFTTSAPDAAPQQREMYNITTGQTKNLPRGVSRSINYNLPVKVSQPDDNVQLDRRFGQIYDEQGDPLKINYIANGQPVPSTAYDSPTLSTQQKFNSPIINEDVVEEFYRVTGNIDQRITSTTDLRVLNLPQGGATFDSRVYAYDFYGGEINDPLRGPYFRTDLITRDLSKPAPYDNILRAEQNGTPYYGKPIYDIFNNRIIGVQENNATVIRKNLLPLELDRFNHPIKSPNKTIGRLEGF